MYNLNMLMAFISWWYGKGWAWRANKILDGIERSIDTFSLGLLVKTWFAPFRQIDAGNFSNASLEIRIRKFFDRLISRFIGAFLRSIVIFVGIFYISFKALFGIFMLILWGIMPIAPIIFVVIFTSGWTPKILPEIKKNFQKPQNSVQENFERGQNVQP